MSLPSHTGGPSPKGSAGLGQPVLSAIPWAVGSHPGFVCPWMKNGFYIFNGWGKSKKRILFCDTWEFHEIQICVHKILLEERYTHLFRCFLWSLSWAELSSCLVLHRKFLTTSVPWCGGSLELRRTGRSQNLWVQLGEIWELQPLWILSKKQKEPNVWGSSLRILREDTSKCGCFILSDSIYL